VPARAYRRATARRDLVEHFVYLAESGGLNLADHFLSAASTTFANLAEEPNLGAQVCSRNPRLAGLRKWRIKGFERHLVFYLPRRDGISVVRVLHASRDWWQLLGIEPE